MQCNKSILTFIVQRIYCIAYGGDFSRHGKLGGMAQDQRGIVMFKNFEDIQKYSKDQMEAATAASATIIRRQAVRRDHRIFKKSLEGATAAFEKLIASKSLDGAIQVRTDYAKTAYEAFVAQNKKIGEMYAGLAKEFMKPVETVVAAAQAK